MSKIRNGVQFLSQKAVLDQIRSAANHGVQYYKHGNFKQAETEFVKVLKPLLSKPLMKAAHPENIPEVKTELLGAMSHLGEIYARSHHYHNNYSKAAAIFQYSAKFADKYEIETDSDSELIFPRLDAGGLDFSCPEYFLHRAYSTEREFLSSLVARQPVEDDLSATAQRDYFFSYHENILAHQAALQSIRATVKGRLEEIGKFGIEDISIRARKVEDLYRESTQFLVNHDRDTSNTGFIQRLLHECYEQLGPVPEGCEHSVVALGSLSLGTMTPWSDLEFAILVSQDREDYKEYFRNLTKLLHIRSINLGETPLQSVGIESLNNFRTANAGDDWFLDDITTKGFGFDSAIWRACKNPLGRQGGYKVERKVKNDQGVEEVTLEDKPDYELILTPQEMAAIQFAEADGVQTGPSFASDRYLVQALRSNALIDGSQELLDDYRARLHTEDPEQVQILQTQALEILQEDVDKFSLKLGDEEEGKIIDVKKDIYRLGDRVVNALANYYGIAAEAEQPMLTVWQKIGAMRDRAVISSDGAERLKEAMSIATELRLLTYQNNTSQADSMSTFVPAVDHLDEAMRHKLLVETFHMQDTSLLHHFYYVMLKVQDVVRVFCHDDYHRLGKLLLGMDHLYDDSNYNRAMVHARFLEYDKAMVYLEVAKEEQPGNLQLLQNLYFLYSKTGAIDKSIDIAQEIQTLVRAQNQANLNHPDIATSHNNLGEVYRKKGEYDAAIVEHKKALEIQLVAFVSTPGRLDIAMTYHNLGNAYFVKGEYDASMEECNKAMDICKAVYASNLNHPYIAKTYNNLGNIYFVKGEYDASIEEYNKALKIQLVAYASSPNHLDIADSYHNLGNVYFVKGEYDASIEECNKALKIRLVAYASSPNHLNIAGSYNNLGLAYAAKGKYDVAIGEYNKALDIYKAVYASNLNHPYIAKTYNNLGNAYADKGYYDKAIREHNKALDIYKVVYASNLNHPDIADTYNNLGNAYADKGDYDTAIEHYKKALDIRLITYVSNSNHPDIAKTYNNLGSAYADKGDYDTAIEHYKKALDIYKVAYASNPNHPDIADSYNNLGLAYADKGKYDVAIGEYNKVLDIYKAVYASNLNHPYIAKTYNNLGLAYAAKGKYDVAIVEYNKALDIYKVVYASNLNHPYIAKTYNNLGNAYADKGYYDKAIREHNKALDIYKVVYASNLNHHYIADSYNDLGNIYVAKGYYDKAVKEYQTALAIYEKVYAFNLNHPRIAKTYNSLCATYSCKGEYKKALSYANNEALRLAILMQLGNQAFLADNLEQAMEYYKQLHFSFNVTDFYFRDFIELQEVILKQSEHMKSLPAAINTLLVLIKVDPEMHYGNHHHDLACLYACQGNVEEANQAFQKALQRSKNSGLVYVDYAQFLILNRDNDVLYDSVKIISECLYAVINGANVGNLTYGPIVKDGLCSVLSDAVKEKKAGIKVDPKALAYYLLIKHPEYMRAGDSVESLLKKFQDMCAKQSLNTGSFDEVSAILLTDAYKSLHQGPNTDVNADKDLDEPVSPTSVSDDVTIVGDDST